MLFGPEAGSGTYIDILTYDDTSMTGIENGSIKIFGVSTLRRGVSSIMVRKLSI